MTFTGSLRALTRNKKDRARQPSPNTGLWNPAHLTIKKDYKMITPIRPAPPSWTRLSNEPSKAYLDFCIYRDLGRGRSLDRACKLSYAEQGKDHGSARRTGQWADWSQKFNWVARAEAYDDWIDEEKRSAHVAKLQELEDMKLDFAVENQRRKQDLVRNMDATLERGLAAPFTEISQRKDDEAAWHEDHEQNEVPHRARSRRIRARAEQDCRLSV